MEQLNILIGQMTSVDDVEANLNTIFSMMKKSPDFSLACFPENSLFLRMGEGVMQYMELTHPAFESLAKFARDNKKWIHLGSVPLMLGTQKRNASVLIDPQGIVQSKYQKIHLFDIDLPGHKKLQESDFFGQGSETSLFEVEGWRIGQSICYDLRFSELYSRYAYENADLILIPSAFLVPTGEAHWDILVRARAIESQAYVVAAAQAGTHKNLQGAFRETYGHSLVVDPWGQKLFEGSRDQAECKIVTLDKKKIQTVRQQIPMARHRRLGTIKG